MDDSNNPSFNKNQLQPPLGMNAFGSAEREQFGHNVRLAMACIEAAPQPVKGYALPQDEPAIRQRLKALSQEITSHHADLLELLVRFDDLQGWKSCGARHCAAWMNLEIGISIQLSWEYLRVGRKLQTLPTVKALFRVGKLSWSKVRLITRVADSDNEKILCHAALDASVSDVKRLCEGYRWSEDEDGADGKNERVLQQWASRALTWHEASNGSTRIQLVLPPEIAQAFLHSVEQSLSQLGTVGSTIDNTASQNRADAAVLMAETSLQNAGRAIATADRYQVSVSIDASELSTGEATVSTQSPAQTPTHIPSKNPTLNGVGPIAVDTARRIACDCSLTVTHTNKSEPIDIGRKSRIWPNSMARVIKERDQHCAWPGCTHSRHLHIHHIKHWADGGETSVHNGVCLCSYHHTQVHEGGYTIEHVAGNTAWLHEQFTQQQHHNDTSLFDFEKSLRNDKESFNTVRRLSPIRYRYRFLDSDGRDLSSRSTAYPQADAHRSTEQTTEQTTEQSTNQFHDHSNEAVEAGTEYTRVYNSDSTHAEAVGSTSLDISDSARTHTDQLSILRCREAFPQGYIHDRKTNHAHAFTAFAFTQETPQKYEKHA